MHVKPLSFSGDHPAHTSRPQRANGAAPLRSPNRLPLVVVVVGLAMVLLLLMVVGVGDGQVLLLLMVVGLVVGLLLVVVVGCVVVLLQQRWQKQRRQQQAMTATATHGCNSTGNSNSSIAQQPQQGAPWSDTITHTH